MHSDARRGGVKLVGVLVVVALLATALAIGIPAIQHARENARQKDCLNKMRQLGLALGNYHDSQGGFPALVQLTVDRDPLNLDGYSFLFDMLPHLESKPLIDVHRAFDERSRPRNRDPKKNDAVAEARLGCLACPSYSGPNYLDEAKKRFAITNYKAMSATHPESLACATDRNAVPKYGTREQHPDGGLHPTRKLHLRDFTDGTKNTMFLVETIDSTGSYWAAGNTSALVVLPSTVSYVSFEKPNEFQFWAPAGCVPGKWYDEANYDNPTTYFKWDYAGEGPNAGPYDATTNVTFGPSSAHPGVINCAFGDGTARSVRKDLDQGLLMFLVTRAGHDPSQAYFARKSEP